MHEKTSNCRLNVLNSPELQIFTVRLIVISSNVKKHQQFEQRLRPLHHRGFAVRTALRAVLTAETICIANRMGRREKKVFSNFTFCAIITSHERSTQNNNGLCITHSHWVLPKIQFSCKQMTFASTATIRSPSMEWWYLLRMEWWWFVHSCVVWWCYRCNAPCRWCQHVRRV